MLYVSGQVSFAGTDPESYAGWSDAPTGPSDPFTTRDPHSFHPRSQYVELYWLGSVGLNKCDSSAAAQATI